MATRRKKKPVSVEAKVEYLPLEEIARWPRNPKRHDLEGIRASIRRFGFIAPLVRDEHSGSLVAGHGRLDALLSMREAGDPTPQGIHTGPAGTWLAPVVTGLHFASEQEAEAYVVADNRLTEVGGWDEELLGQILRDQAEAAPLGSVGFNDAELARLLATVEVPPADAPPAGPPPPGSGGSKHGLSSQLQPLLEQAHREWVPEFGVEAGKVWRVRSASEKSRVHSIMCGDATNPAHVQKLCGGVEVDLMVVDPPYCSGGFQESGRQAGTWGQIASDTLSTRGYQTLIRRLYEAVRPQVSYTFTDWRMWIPLYDVVESSGLPIRGMLVWDKGHSALGSLWRPQHELVMFANRRGGKRMPGQGARGNVIQAPRSGNRWHYTEKSIAVILQILQNDAKSERGRRPFIDPMAGGGTAIVAGEQDRRPVYAMDIEPMWCAVMLHRLVKAEGMEVVAVE